MTVKIDIGTKTFIRFWLVLIVFMLAGFAIFKSKDAILLLVISAFLASALNAPVSKIAKILPGSKKNRVGATAVAYLLIITIIGLFISLIAPAIIDQTSKFAKEAPQIFENITAKNSGLRLFVEQNNLEGLIDQLSNNFSQTAKDVSKNLGNIIFGSVTSFANIIVSTFLILTITFLMLVEGPSWLEKIWKMHPDKEKQKQHKRIAKKMYRAVANFVNGQLTISAISGVLGASVVAILSLTLGIPLGLVIPVGIIMFMIGMIPMFGPMVGGVLVTLILSFNYWLAGAIFLTYYLIYQQIENNVIAPIIQAKSNQLSALIIIVAITIGIYAGGIMGAFISIPAAACIKILFDELVILPQRKNKKLAQTSFEDI